jgi:DNA-binding MarR family transcriptional regulator
MNDPTDTASAPDGAAVVDEAASAPAYESIDDLDHGILRRVIGYHSRRTYRWIFKLYAERMARFDLRPVEFSILSYIHYNPGISPKLLARALGVVPPNLVNLLAGLERRGLFRRAANPRDRRSQVLHLTEAGTALIVEAECVVEQFEDEASAPLTVKERDTLIRLLKKVYERD